MSKVISFTMALDKEPERERKWQYRALTLKGLKKGQTPTCIVVEEGVGVIHLTVTRDDQGTHFALSDKTEFSQADVQRAVAKVTTIMFETLNSNGVINNVK